MRQIEVINLETIIDVTAETSNVEILVKDYDSELVERFALEAQEAAIDAEESADIANAQASIATAQAGIATTQAGIATTQAGIATTQSGIATTKANEASASAASALASEQAADADRILAQTAATTATTQAGIATTQAGIATTKAGEASASADDALASQNSASGSASTATTQAGIATTQAGIATTQAGNALTSANNAAASAAAAAQVGTSTLLTGFSTGANSTILATDTILQGFNKTQGQINARVSGTIATGQVAFGTAANTIGGGNNLFWDNTNGRLGVGITTPSSRLEVAQTSTGNLDYLTIYNTGGGAVNDQTALSFEHGGNRRSSKVFSTLESSTSTALGFVTTASTVETEKLRVFSSGNVLIQAGGTFTDAGFRLDVNGSTRFNGLSTIQGTTASDSGQLGAELLTTGTGDASWTGTDFATGYTHVAGSTTTLTSTLAGVVGASYQITYTVTGRTAGSFTIAFGGFTSAALTATGNLGPRATTTGTLVITPTSDFNGTIVLSIRTISASSASVTFNNSAGTVTNQIRISSIATNIFIGLNSGRNNTTGPNNTFFGNSSGANNTTGGSNSFFGVSSGAANTTGGSNAFFGQGSGQANTTGGGSSFFGQGSGFVNSTGSSNSFFGQSSGQNNTTASNNSFFGHNSGFSNTTGASNSFFGANAGFFSTTGANNCFVGFDAGRRIANGNALPLVNNSIFIGIDTRANADNQTNQIVIGHNATGLGSNTTVLGNSSTTHGRWYGNLLIGTDTNSGFALDVNGTARVQGVTTITGSTTAASAIARGANLTSTLVAAANNDVLVGLDLNPTFTNGAFTGVTNLNLRAGGIALRADGVLNWGSALTGNNRGILSWDTNLAFVNGVVNLALYTAGSNRLQIFSNGNIGINTTTNIASSILTVDSTTKGFLPPRMTTTQKNAIASPATGLVVYDNTLNKLSVFTGATWETVTSV